MGDIAPIEARLVISTSERNRFMGLNHPYASFIHTIEKPARYLGGEYQSVVKDWESVDATVCMAFPDIYDIGMSHLGTKIIYKVLNDHPAIACERAFTPWPDMEAALRQKQLPLLSLESARPLADFDIIGVSLQYEMTFTNMLNILDLAGLPLRAADRGEDYPLVLAGGPVGYHPEPIAPFLDAVLIGEAEEAFPEAITALAGWKKEGLPKAERLQRLAALGGWYVPTLYGRKLDDRNAMRVVDPDSQHTTGPYPVERRFVEDLNDFPYPDNSPVAAAEAIFDRMSIEIARGCTEGCRFCQAGMVYRPVRERDPEAIVDTVIKAIDNGGYDKVSLTSLSTADYSCVSPLIKKVMTTMRERKASLSVSSLRAYGLDEDLLDEISSVKATGLTFAPEAGTERMRKVINKTITEEDLITTAHRIFSRGWQRMKLYFMIGLPTETDEDVIGIIDTAIRARRVGFQYHHKRKIQVVASASSHVPKPHTPFQWAAMATLDEIAHKQRILRKMGRDHNITVKYHNVKISYLEGIMARGDERVADVIELAFRKGCRLDGWDEHLNWDGWLEAIEESGIDPQIYLGTLPVDSVLPWDHIDVGLEPKFLYKEWKRAIKGRFSPPCGKPKGAQVHHTNVADADADTRKLICYHCGVACDLGQMREERIDFLTKLKSLTPEDVKPDHIPAYKLLRKNKKGQSLPPLRESQGESFHYRLRFSKTGAIAMTGHLDLARLLPRVMRRAGLKLKYSVGFSPKAQLSFGPALTLGVSSLAEVVDVFTLEEVPEAQLVERLNAVSPEGLVFDHAALLELRSPPPAKVGKLVEYFVTSTEFTHAMVEDALVALRGQEPVTITVVRKKGARDIDVRDGLITAESSTVRAWEAAELGIAEGTTALRWRVSLNDGAHVRPTELAEALFGRRLDSFEGFAAVRAGLWGMHKNQVFDLLNPEAMIPVDDHALLPCGGHD